MELLSVEDITVLERRRRRHWFRYDMSEEVVLEGVSFTVRRGETFAVVGEERSGKHALVMALLKLQEVDSGKIVFAEVDTTALGQRHFRRLRKRLQAVFSDEFGQLTPELTVDGMFREALQVWYPRARKEDWQHRVESVMVACHLPEAIRALYPAELDAVERQQVALARALLPQPDFLICHGFTSGLDAVQEAELLNLLGRVREDLGLTMLVVTDDLAVAHQLSDTVAILHRGRILETGPAEAVVSHPKHEYTKRLVSCSL